jgi:hypothetical protein
MERMRISKESSLFEMFCFRWQLLGGGKREAHANHRMIKSKAGRSVC